MNIKTIGAAILAGAMVAGCGEKAVEDEVAVSVNGEKLMQSAIDADIEQIFKKEGDRIPSNQVEYVKRNIANQMAQSFIVEKVLVANAKKLNLAVTEEDRKERAAEYLKSWERMPDSPKTMEEYFQKYPLGEARARAEFDNGVLIEKLIKAEMERSLKKDYSAEAQKIVDAAKAADEAAQKKIADLKAQLDKVSAENITNEFARLASENSDCPSKAKGGDLSVFTHGMMVKEFDEAAFKLPVNTVSDPVRTQFGYHLILTTKKFAAVEAKGDQPAEPEKVQASHILIRAEPVPELEEAKKRLESMDKRMFAGKYITSSVRAANVEASEAYKHLLPPEEEAPSADETAPVEKPAEK